jgi:DNA-binding response OmpR family regulator
MDGEAALDLLERGGEYDLVILDLHMPKVDGFQVLSQVRGTVTTAGMPVIVFTGSDDGESEVHAMELGADDYIRKPIDPPRFVARVKAVLRRAEV